MIARHMLMLAGVAIAVTSTFAQQPETKQPEKPAEKPAATPPPAQPSLDELLGLKPKPGDKPATTPTKPDEPAPSTDAAPDQSKTDLDRLLSAQEIGNAFKQAIALMGDASKRMNDHADNGLGTQRVQEDVVKRLDQLLASLDKQKQQGGGSPKPSPKNGDSPQDPGQSKPKPKPGPGEGTQSQPGGDGAQAQGGPTLQEGALKPELESARAAWGSLPARIRAMLMQGTEDRFSARYKGLTQEYYKRLAEENSK